MHFTKKYIVILLTGLSTLFLVACGGSRNTGLDKESEAHVLSVIEITNQQFSKHMEKEASIAEVPTTTSFSLERKKLVLKVKATRDLTDKEIQNTKMALAMAAMWPQMILNEWRTTVNKEKEVVTDQFFEKLCEAKVEFFVVAENHNGDIIAEVPIPLSAYKTPLIPNNSDNPDGMKAPDTTGNLNEETEKELHETVQMPPEKKETILDPRDGRSYEIAQIGSQIWLAENLHYMTDESYCYKDDTSYCDKYGRLYTWNAAKDACPEGWHLPSKDEFSVLIDAVGGENVAGKMLKSVSGWGTKGNGIDAYSFAALPAGDFFDGKYDFEGFVTFFWSSTLYSEYSAYHMNLYYDNRVALDDYSLKDYIRYSVRCLKD